MWYLRRRPWSQGLGGLDRARPHAWALTLTQLAREEEWLQKGAELG